MSLAKVGAFKAGSAAIETPESTSTIDSASAPVAEIRTSLSLNPISIIVVSLLACAREPVERQVVYQIRTRGDMPNHNPENGPPGEHGNASGISTVIPQNRATISHTFLCRTDDLIRTSSRNWKGCNQRGMRSGGVTGKRVRAGKTPSAPSGYWVKVTVVRTRYHRGGFLESLQRGKFELEVLRQDVARAEGVFCNPAFVMFASPGERMK